MGKNAFLFWLLAAPAVATGLAWLAERMAFAARRRSRRIEH